jgi:molecular chaperone DnaK (HSP70)
MNLKDISPKATPKKMNSLMETRFGFKIDFNKLTYNKAVHLTNRLTENINKIRRSYGLHTAERDPKYLELLMVRESLHKWLSTRRLVESELGRAEAALAAKDMVDSIQDMVEKVSKMQVEQLPALVDTIRDQPQLGQQQAEQFKSTMNQLLTDLATTLSQAREAADASARQLAGEEVSSPMNMPGAAPMGTAPAGAMAEPEDDDNFAALDAAAGGTEPLGREKR